MQLFLQRLKLLVFSSETLVSIILGIILGTFLGLPYYIGLFALLGWMIIPSALLQLLSGHDTITHSIGGGGFPNPAWVGWVNWGIVLFYIIFLCFYGWYAYQTTRRSGSISAGISATLWSALVMILSAIIPSTLSMQFAQQISFSSSLFYLKEALQLCLLFTIPLAVMALLTGFIGSLAGKWLYAKIATKSKDLHSEEHAI